jgi:hypothetical protein
MLAGRLLKNFHDGLRTIRLLPDNTNQEIAKRPAFLQPAYWARFRPQLMSLRGFHMGNRLNLISCAVTFILAECGTVFAADMPLKAPPPAAAPSYSWTGWYVGLTAGYGWGDPSLNLKGDNDAASREPSVQTASQQGLKYPQLW